MQDVPLLGNDMQWLQDLEGWTIALLSYTILYYTTILNYIQGETYDPFSDSHDAALT